MYYYFSADFPAAIKFNGIYYGVISKTVKSIRIDGDCPLVEVCPLTASERQINFIPNTDFLSAPSEGILVTDLRGGFLVKILKNFKVGEFKILDQLKASDLAVTAFIENGVKISIETLDGFFADTVDCFADSAKITKFSLEDKTFVAVHFSGSDNLLVVYSLSKQIKKVFSRQVKNFSLDGGFYTTEEFVDIAKHTVHSEWKWENDSFTQKNKSASCKEGFSPTSLPDAVFPYAFLEELLVGNDVTDYLDDTIKPNANKLKDFLGEFIGIMPPPTFRTGDEIGLIFTCGKNKYRVDYITFELIDKKILNVKKSER
jgi:hypothetical protein